MKDGDEEYQFLREDGKIKIGAYSGSERLDPAQFEEPDADTAYVRDLWFTEFARDPDFLAEMEKKLADWKAPVALTTDASQIRVHVVGESHIDIAWLWRYEQTRKKGAVTFRKAVYHAQKFPGTYCYALSEPILLQWIKEDDPDLFADIQAAVAAGGIELVGGSYVEPDCMMPCGEAMVRSRLYGQRFYRDNFGQLADVEWFLDSFGYNAGLPQILVKSGARFFWTSKITWNLQTLFPFVHFWWEGVDGSRLLTCNFPMAYGALERWVFYEMGHRPLREGVSYRGTYERDYEDIVDFVDMDVAIPHVGCFFGKGDGGHGPTHEEVTRANALVAMDDLFQWSRVQHFFEGIWEWRDRLPVWADELYLENHRGTFSVHAEVKRHNRLFENWLVSTEALATALLALGLPRADYPGAVLERTWKTLLKNQFHDVLPGTSIPEVYDDVHDDWQACQRDLTGVETALARHLALPAGCHAVLWNSLAWPRVARVFVPVDLLPVPPELDAEGRPPRARLRILAPANAGASGTAGTSGPAEIEVQETVVAQPVAAEPAGWHEARPAGWWAVLELPATSVTPVALELASEDAATLTATASADGAPTLDNGVVRVALDPATGGIATFTSARVPGVANLVQGEANNLTEAYEDKSKAWPAWNLTPEYWKFPVALDNAREVTLRVRDAGPVFATIEVTRVLGPADSPVTQLYTVFRDNPALYCEYVADWRQENVMLKVGLATTTGATTCTADVMFGALTRSTRPETPADQARFEKICHKYYDVSTPDRQWGVTTLNEGKYAFDAEGGRTRITMLRSPPYHGPAGEAWVHKERAVREAKYGTRVPTHTGLGPFRCRYAYFPHVGGALQDASGSPDAVAARAAEEFNAPVRVIPVSIGNAPPNPESGTGTGPALEVPATPLVAVESPHARLTAFKVDEWEGSDALVLRLAETSGLAGEAVVHLAPEIARRVASVRYTDLLERPLADRPPLSLEDGLLRVPLTTFEVVSLQVVLR